MPSKAGLKRTIKLRQPNAAGQQFIKVKNKAYSYPIFDWFPDWFSIGGVAGLNDWINASQNFQKEQADQAAAWLRPWSLENTNFTFSTHVPGEATFAEIVEFWNPTVTIIPANVMTFIFGKPNKSHFIGTIDQNGNITRTP